MPKIAGADFPIRHDKCSGPALGEWDNRKEDDDAAPFVTATIRETWRTRGCSEIIKELDALLYPDG